MDAALEQGVYAALETYSNVHRGSGHNSVVTTHLFELARDIIIEYLGLDKSKYTVVFCTPGRAALLKGNLGQMIFVVCQAEHRFAIRSNCISRKKKRLTQRHSFSDWWRDDPAYCSQLGHLGWCP